jgi:quinol monooxygenase YgiN
MIVILAEVEIAPEALAPFKQAIAEMEIASRAEPGCHDYCFSQELSNSDKIRIVELWESMEALEAHFVTPHMQRFTDALTAASPRSMHARVHELGAERSLPGPGS